MSVLTIENVQKKFKDGDTEIVALEETSFTAEKGEFIAIIGPSGSGKSTFLSIAAGLQEPTQGRVMINDKPFSEKKEKERARIRFEEVGFILQASNLIPFLKVSDQLKLVDKLSKKEKSQLDLLELLGIEKLKNKFPEQISGGEKQRVAIARALYNNPSIIFADEPTASLDSKRAMDVVDVLAKMTKQQNKTTIMVTHDLRLIAQCDKVYEMNDGVLTLRENNDTTKDAQMV
ncbi:ABC transporter ATP-binding protein [Aerococcus sp. NPDC058936]|uniref:ABC transporter ATP-binding protein n=1 Tax=Aerococcus sp. NPDC058936 TaxID=3346674 RepID=UPI0036705D35